MIDYFSICEIRGYQVLDKYLKSHKGKEIKLRHFMRVIQSLYKSLEIESQITNIELDISSF